MRGVTGYRADAAAPRNYAEPDRTLSFRSLHLRGGLGWHCSNILTARSTPRIRAMSNAEFYPRLRELLVAYRKRNR